MKAQDRYASQKGIVSVKLGIIAGGGSLPARIVRLCVDNKRPVFVIAFHNETNTETCEGTPHTWLNIGEVGEVIRRLKLEKCEEVVFAGSINRPSLSKLKMDMRALKLLAKIKTVSGKGDNALLSLLVNELENEKFRVVGADELLKSNVPLGLIAGREPNPNDKNDIQIGLNVVTAMGKLDVGQAAVIEEGLVIGVEAIEGTDKLLRRCLGLKRESKGGVLVKLKKPNQEERIDLPTIGINTVQIASKIGLSGIAIHANHSIIIDREKVIEEANKVGLFIIGVKA